MTTYDALRARFAADGPDAESRLEKALDEIGWRGAHGLPSDEVAGIAVEILRECVHSHRDVSRATDELAELLRSAAAILDGGSMSTDMFIPAAEEVIRLYAGSTI